MLQLSRSATSLLRCLLTSILLTQLGACGNSHVKHVSKLAIMGGTTLPIDHPLAQSTVQLEFTGSVGHEVCTGTLIAPRWVLTAAHCQSETFLVYPYLGSQRDSSRQVNGRAVRFVEEPVTVEDWKASSYTQALSDLLLVKLDHGLLHSKQQAVPIAAPDLLTLGNGPWTIVGTGAHFDQVNILRSLRSMELKELSLDSKLRMLSSPGRPINKGDSGGGLFVKKDRYELLAVLSGSIDYRARWTYLPDFSQQIRSTIEKEDLEKPTN